MAAFGLGDLPNLLGLVGEQLGDGERKRRHVKAGSYSIEVLLVVDDSVVRFHGKEHVQNYVLTLMNIVSGPASRGVGWGAWGATSLRAEPILSGLVFRVHEQLAPQPSCEAGLSWPAVRSRPRLMSAAHACVEVPPSIGASPWQAGTPGTVASGLGRIQSPRQVWPGASQALELQGLPETPHLQKVPDLRLGRLAS